METTPSGSGRTDPLDHPLYRMAHLHGTEWVTLRPEEQHSGTHDETAAPFDGATIYRCETCDERVAVGPPA